MFGFFNKTSTSLYDAIPTVVVQRSRGWSSLGLRDLWEYRELVYFLIWRKIKGTYRQTALGFSWLFLQPVVNMVVLSLIFGRLIKVPSDGMPYPVFSLAALQHLCLIDIPSVRLPAWTCQ